jgi:alpha-glucuronidase
MVPHNVVRFVIISTAGAHGGTLSVAQRCFQQSQEGRVYEKELSMARVDAFRWIRYLSIFLLGLCQASAAHADDGYDLWLKYKQVGYRELHRGYEALIRSVAVPGESPTAAVIRAELKRGLHGLLGKGIPVSSTSDGNTSVLVSKLSKNDSVLSGRIGKEGYVISSTMRRGARTINVSANSDIGLLYGVFHFLRLIQTGKPLTDFDIVEHPAIQYRLLDHWDNLDGSIERGYAGTSLWKWKDLPDTIDPRYDDYARANASLGINGVVLNNVNANPVILKHEYLVKVAALAGVLRPYGIRVFLSANFSSPISAKFELEGNRRAGIGDLMTSDPLNPEVKKWWKKKAEEIYSLIPDFGGFLVKANSEGMPGPHEYGRSHADGANMLADAVAPFGGVVMWRAFVYEPDVDTDRVKRSYKEFVPLDGQFHPNVFIQAKNGPLDFQPREPVQALFGAMPKTPLMLELQFTQEYLGHSTHLVYLAPMWEEYLAFDTYAHGPGSTLASIIDGSVQHYPMTGIAGVANIGDDRNWCGHFFAQANWYAFGRLAWNPGLTAGEIADDWIRMSLTTDSSAVRAIQGFMMGSREACVNYTTPLGLHHIMQEGFHYGPGPQHNTGREDWRSTYYHRADSTGLGFDRSLSGSNAVSQYNSPLKERFDNIDTCPEKYLLWFHHVRWDQRMNSGHTLWDELCGKYYEGTAYVDQMARTWESLRGVIDPEIFNQVNVKLEKQKTDAAIWRDTCLDYFQTFSHRLITQRQGK